MGKILKLLIALGVMLPALALAGEKGVAPGRRTLRVCYSAQLFSEVSRYDAQAATKVWVESLMRRMVEQYDQCETIILGDLDAIAELIAKNRADVFILMAHDYVRLEKRYGLVPAVYAVSEAPGYNRFCVLARKDAGLRDLGQLKGKSLLIDTNLCGDIPQAWLEVWLADHNLPGIGRFFSGAKPVNKPSSAILPVFFKQADACLVRLSAFDTMSELNPQVGAALTPLLTSGELITCVTSFNPKIAPEIQRLLKQCMVKLNEEPEVKQILTLFKTDRLLFIDSEKQLDPLRKLVGRYEALQHPGGKPSAEPGTSAVSR